MVTKSNYGGGGGVQQQQQQQQQHMNIPSTYLPT